MKMNETELLKADSAAEALLTAEESRRYLGLSRSLFDRSWKAGEIPKPRKSGRVYRWYNPELARYVATGEVGK